MKLPNPLRVWLWNRIDERWADRGLNGSAQRYVREEIWPNLRLRQLFEGYSRFKDPEYIIDTFLVWMLPNWKSE